MLHSPSLLPKLAADFVYSIDAADNEHLVVEFGSHAHVTIDVQFVVVSDERLCCRATCDGKEN